MRKRRGRHEGSLTQRGDGLWEARRDVGISAEGKRRRVSAYGKTKAEALENLSRKVAVGVRSGASVKLTLAEYLHSWLDETKLLTAFTTYASRESTCRNHVFPFIGGVSLQRLQVHHLTGLLLNLQDNGVGAPTLRAVHTTLSAALNLAKRRGIIPANPIADLPKPRAPRKPIEPWTLAEALRFLDAAEESEYCALFVLALTTGMRQGELFGLHWRDIDLTNGSLRVVRSLAEGPKGSLILKEPKTASSVRTIELPGVAVRALEAHPVGDSEFVFTSPDGTPLRKSNFLRRVFHPLVESANVRRIRFHVLRHTSNTLLLTDGVSPNVVAQRMGHSSTRMTLDVYGHVLTGAQRAAADKLDAAFGRS